ncbi:putative ribonuclease H-like domain-containing protein [Tanacetum coccineum]
MNDNTRIFASAYDDEDVDGQADLNNLETTMNVSSIPTTRINKDHPIELIIRDLHSALLTKRMLQQNLKEHCLVSYINKQRRTNHKDYQNCLFAYFLSQKEPKKVIQALENPSWIEAMQEELLKFELQKVWTLVDLHNGKRTIGTKWVFKNKKDKRGIVVRNKARLVAQDDAQEIPDEFYRGAHLLFRSTVSTPMEPNKALVKDDEADNVDVHLYKSMIGSLMYLTASRPDITFVVCACARFQVTPKTSHLHVMKRIFRYLKGQPKLGLWYPRDSPFDLETFSNSDYAGASLDRKSTTGGCQFLGKRLISWQCKKQTIVANSTTEAEYVTAANCYRQNLKFHAKTKHIEIRHHFIRDSYEKRLIQVIKVHSDQNVADLLTKAFDVSRGRDTKIPQSGGPPLKVGDKAIYKELGDRMERDVTTDSSLEAEQDSGSGPRVNTLRSGEDSMKLMELMAHCTKLSELFWQTATTSTLKDGDMGIIATIDGKVKVVSEASIRRHLKIEYYDGISTLSTAESFEKLALMGNMKRAFKGYTRVDTPLFQTMLVQGQTLQGKGSTIPVESYHTPTSAPSTLQPPTSSPYMPTTHVAEEATPMPHDSPLPRVHLLGSDEGSLTLNELITYGAGYTKLIMKVKKLEHKVKSIKSRRKVKFVISDDKDDLEDPSKQGRKITQIDKDEGITLFQISAQTQGRSDEDLMYETGVYDYPEGFTGPSISITTIKPVTAAGDGVSTDRAIHEEVSTAEPDMDVTLTEALVDLLKSGKKNSPKPKAIGISFQDPKEVARREVISPPVLKISVKDKGTSIMTEPEKPLKKKDQIQSDEELALRLHAEEQAEFERL